MLARAETTEGFRAMIDAERRHLFAVRVAPDDEARRRLALSVAEGIDGVESNQRHEQRAALDFEQAKLLARQADDAAEAHPLQRRDRDPISALPAGLSEELPKNLVL